MNVITDMIKLSLTSYVSLLISLHNTLPSSLTLGVNVTYPSRPGTPPLSSTQLLINPEEEEFQLVDLSRRFLILDSYWTLPRQFLGNKVQHLSCSPFLQLLNVTPC
jgi:hypothetical protein